MKTYKELTESLDKSENLNEKKDERVVKAIQNIFKKYNAKLKIEDDGFRGNIVKKTAGSNINISIDNNNVTWEFTSGKISNINDAKSFYRDIQEMYEVYRELEAMI